MISYRDIASKNVFGFIPIERKIEENDNCLNMNNGCIKNTISIDSKTLNTEILNVNKLLRSNQMLQNHENRLKY